MVRTNFLKHNLTTGCPNKIKPIFDHFWAIFVGTPCITPPKISFFKKKPNKLFDPFLENVSVWKFEILITWISTYGFFFFSWEIFFPSDPMWSSDGGKMSLQQKQLWSWGENKQQHQKFGVYQSECPGNWLENCHTKGQHVSLHHYRVSSPLSSTTQYTQSW